MGCAVPLTAAAAPTPKHMLATNDTTTYLKTEPLSLQYISYSSRQKAVGQYSSTSSMHPKGSTRMLLYCCSMRTAIGSGRVGSSKTAVVQTKPKRTRRVPYFPMRRRWAAGSRTAAIAAAPFVKV